MPHLPRIKSRLPDFAEALDDQVPEGSELLGGSLQFWKELRLPTAKVYVAALGKLIAQVEYSPEQGWHNKFDKVEGTRRVLGLVTPPPGIEQPQRLMSRDMVIKSVPMSQDKTIPDFSPSK